MLKSNRGGVGGGAREGNQSLWRARHLLGASLLASSEHLAGMGHLESISYTEAVARGCRQQVAELAWAGWV